MKRFYFAGIPMLSDSQFLVVSLDVPSVMEDTDGAVRSDAVAEMLVRDHYQELSNQWRPRTEDEAIEDVRTLYYDTFDDVDLTRNFELICVDEER